MIHDHGAYTARGVNVAFEAMQTLTMPYNVPACSLKVTLALTNKVPVTPVRGAGQPQAFSRWSVCSIAWRPACKLDRADVRRRNLVRREQMPCSKPFKTRSDVPVVIDSGDFLASQDTGARGWLGGMTSRVGRVMREPAERYFGIGSGQLRRIDRTRPFEPATVRIASSGKVHVLSSAAAMGQSTKTMLAQIVAAQLGGDISNIIVTTGDSVDLDHRLRRIWQPADGDGGIVGARRRHRRSARRRWRSPAIFLKPRPAISISAVRIVHLKGAAGMKIGLADIAKASLGCRRRLSSLLGCRPGWRLRRRSSSTRWPIPTAPRLPSLRWISKPAE